MTNQALLLPPNRRCGRQHLIRICWVAIYALALASCGAALSWQYTSALQRWQAQAAGHYRLATDEVINSYSCAQEVEIRDEQVVNIIQNNCLQPSLWTVSWLFKRAASADQALGGCGLNAPGVGCVCRNAVEARVTYDPALGFPRSIVIRQTWAAAWQRPSYWYYTLRNFALPNCTSPYTGLVWSVAVRQLRPLP